MSRISQQKRSSSRAQAEASQMQKKYRRDSSIIFKFKLRLRSLKESKVRILRGLG